MWRTSDAYLERVYAGVLGKIIGVYLGRPFEGWLHGRILAELGEVDHYVHERLGVPLVVTDDDITGTFTFLRALEDSGCDPNLTAAQIGDNWLNYIIENRTILWWGGRGMSTEHTAYLNLKAGMTAPASGSIATTGAIVAEQIGAQIFIDGWGLVNPGEPERAAHFARLAGSVSHDGVAVDCAQVVAAMVAAAFDRPTIEQLFDIGTRVIHPDSPVRQLISDVREWHGKGLDWIDGFAKIEEKYGYDKYPGNCHVIPNHAVILHALLHGQGDFTRSLMVANTCGWDTDCNSGNVGCIVGVLSGVDGIDAKWRDPVADRIFLPTADGGRTITDALTEAVRIVNMGSKLGGEPTLEPKCGARFHFSVPGSLQGFRGPIANIGGNLEIDLKGGGARVTTPTFVQAEERMMPSYSLIASPTLYPGQVVRAKLSGSSEAVQARICLGAYGEEDSVRYLFGEKKAIPSGEACVLEFTVPDLEGYPTLEAGVELKGNGSALIEWLTWDGEPNLSLGRTPSGRVWREAWVKGIDDFMDWGPSFRLIQNSGTGLLMHGTRDWRDYRVEAELTSFHAKEVGIAVRVQGMRRYYAILITPGCRAILVRENDGRTVLAAAPFAWKFGQYVSLSLEVEGSTIRAMVDQVALVAQDDALDGGAAAFVITDGHCDSDRMRVGPID